MERVFFATLVVALVGSHNAPLKSYWIISVIGHLMGIFVLPALAVISFLLVRPRRLVSPALIIAYLVTALLVYPGIVKRYLETHPGSPGMHWADGSWSDYRYVEIHPEGDPQWSGQVSLFPPYFDIPGIDVK